LLQQKDKWLNYDVDQRKKRIRERAPRFPQIEEGLWMWCLGAMHASIFVTDAILLEKAGLIATQLGVNNETFRKSNGWLNQFKTRHGIHQITLHGEADSVSLNNLPEFRATLQELLSTYHPDDIFNADETGLFWKMMPNKTLATTSRAGKKILKNQVTVMLCCNSSGTEKIHPLVIGHAKTPRPFRRININNLPVDYTFNKKAWMTGILFEPWIKKLDAQMRIQNRQILLLLDNAPGHVEHGLTLSNITIKFLPPNTTSHLQPLDAGIIKSFKVHYRNLHIHWLLQQYENDTMNIPPTLLDAVYNIASAWDTVTTTTISNC